MYEVRRRENSHLRPQIIVVYACYVVCWCMLWFIFVRTFITNIYDHQLSEKYCVLFASKYHVLDANSDREIATTKHTQTKHVKHNTVHARAMHINGGTDIRNKSITIRHTKNDVYNVLRISINRTTVTYGTSCYTILFGHKLRHSKFEIHVHPSHRRLQTCWQNINLSDSNALMALKGDGSWRSHWIIAHYAQTTPTGH